MVDIEGRVKAIERSISGEPGEPWCMRIRDGERVVRIVSCHNITEEEALTAKGRGLIRFLWFDEGGRELVIEHGNVEVAPRRGKQ